MRIGRFFFEVSGVVSKSLGNKSYLCGFVAAGFKLFSYLCRQKQLTVMQELPRITIITVCYNAAEFIERTLRSVAVQDYPDKEYIVVDGGSTDPTMEIVGRYSSAISRVVSEKDKGIYDAMNKGVGLATGEWCIFMNAGDTFASDDVLGRVFFQPRDADVIYGDVIKKDAGGTAFVKKAEPPHNGHRMYFCHQSAFTRTECLRSTPYDVRHRFSADFKLYKQLWKQKRRFLQLDFPVAVFDTSGVSNTHRSQGLADNISVIRQTDGLADKLRLLPRLYFTYFMAKVRGK